MMPLMSFNFYSFRCFLLLACVCGGLFFGGCVSRVDYGPRAPGLVLQGTVVIAPFQNATDDDNAGKAFSDLIGAQLASQGLQVVVLPPKTANELGEVPPYTSADLAEAAKKHGASAIIRGTAIEYRYKTDLDGDPVAGVYVEIWGPDARSAVWHASGSHTGLVYASLASAAQKVASDVVQKMPLR